MPLLPADLRRGRLHFLLDLDWSGTVFRLAEDHLSPVIDGVTLDYSPGLDFSGSWENQLDLFSLTPASHTVDLTLDLSSLVNVPKRIASGYPLGAAVATLYLWVSGTTERHAVMVGQMRQVQYGSKHQAVTATIEEAPLRAPGLIPSEAARVGPTLIGTDFTDPAPKVIGQYYPIIFGRPGGADGWGSPCFFEDTDTNPGLDSTGVISGAECVPGTVVLVNDDTDTEETLTIETGTSVWWTAQNAKVVVRAYVHPETADDVDRPYYIRWTEGNAGGVPSRHDPTAPMRGAGEILAQMLKWSGARVDAGRVSALEPRLAGYRLDAAIVPGDSERVSPIEWIHRHLLPILPISAGKSGDGLFYTFWDWAATAQDAVVDLDADELQMEREGPVEYSDQDDLYHAIRLDYGRDYRADTFQGRLIYTGDRSLKEADSTVVLDQHLVWSFQRNAGSGPRQVRTLEIASEVVLEAATAHLVCKYLARRYGLQSRLVRYVTDPEFAWLEPGHVVTITDAELSLSSAVAIVETVVWTNSERIGLGLRLLATTGLR